MAKQFARKFYSSKAWQDCRNEYAKRRHYLCEECLRHGIYKPGEIVHHRIEIDAVNIERPEITLNHDNLELLCRDCHAARHGLDRNGQREKKKGSQRYVIDNYGAVSSKESPLVR